jgi:hypothetical protein
MHWPLHTWEEVPKYPTGLDGFQQDVIQRKTPACPITSVTFSEIQSMNIKYLTVRLS